ncbi:MAG: hypothetical protein QNL01_15090 [Akkermansiaceae bacterium]
MAGSQIIKHDELVAYENSRVSLILQMRNLGNGRVRVIIGTISRNLIFPFLGRSNPFYIEPYHRPFSLMGLPRALKVVINSDILVACIETTIVLDAMCCSVRIKMKEDINRKDIFIKTVTILCGEDMAGSK